MWNGVNVEGKTFGEATDEQYMCMDPQNGDKSLACVIQFAEFLCLMKIRGSEKYNFKWKKQHVIVENLQWVKKNLPMENSHFLSPLVMGVLLSRKLVRTLIVDSCFFLFL